MNRTQYRQQQTSLLTRREINQVEAIRSMFPRCRYCGTSMEFTAMERIVLLASEQRIAHRRCAAKHHADRE